MCSGAIHISFEILESAVGSATGKVNVTVRSSTASTLTWLPSP